MSDDPFAALTAMMGDDHMGLGDLPSASVNVGDAGGGGADGAPLPSPRTRARAHILRSVRWRASGRITACDTSRSLAMPL